MILYKYIYNEQIIEQLKNRQKNDMGEIKNKNKFTLYTWSFQLKNSKYCVPLDKKHMVTTHGYWRISRKAGQEHVSSINILPATHVPLFIQFPITR